MATYIIGDVQGCHDTLQRLLARCGFGPRDHLWFTGDLVNRGPQSLQVLRFAMGLGDRCRSVLGNHDLHLLARAENIAGPKNRDTLDDVLEAPDAGELIAWLRQRPFVLDEDPWLIVHAGVLPDQDPEVLLARAPHPGQVLRSARGSNVLNQLRSTHWLDLDAIRLTPEFAQCYLSRGGAYMDRAERGTAVQDLSEAIRR